MAKGKKTGGKDFVPGQSGNPNGRPPLPPDIREARKLNQIEFERVVNRFLAYSQNELATACMDPMTPAFELFVIRLIQRGIFEGDHKRFDLLMERLIGKVKTVVEITPPEEKSKGPKTSEMSDSELERRFNLLIAKAKGPASA